MTILNTSLTHLSLKYINKKYIFLAGVSKWFYFELTKFNYKESKFIEATKREDYEKLEVLIKFNKNIDLLSKYLGRWYSHDNKKIIIITKLFIENGANVHIYNDYALRWASKDGYTDMVKLLVENGANVHAKDNGSLRWASFNGYFAIVKLLVENGADVQAQDDYALAWASFNGYFEIVKLLLENGANKPTRRLEWIPNPFMYAIDKALDRASRSGHFDIVKLLIDNGANVNANNNEALIRANANGYYHVVKLLIDNGANKDLIKMN